MIITAPKHELAFPNLVKLFLDLALFFSDKLELLCIGLCKLTASLLRRALLGTQGFTGFPVRPDLFLKELQLHLQKLLSVQEPLFILVLLCII